MVKHANQQSTSQDAVLRLAVSTFGILLTITVLATAIATNVKVNAVTTSANASVNVSAACTLSGGATYVDNIPNNSSKTFGPGTLRATCNDPDGYSIYAIGYSNNTYGNTSMVSTTDPDSPTNIPTNTTGSNSWWAMQLSATGATIQNNFDSLHVIPDTYTKVATKNSVSAGTTGESTVNSNYTVNISSTQAAGTYNGKVKYTLVHPNAAPAPSTLWQTIANMSKGKQTLADLQTEIATPTAESPISSNSGVYEYNAGVFGESSDASNAFPIYYYRGVLDSYGNTGATYGSGGLADAYPNYVKLANNSTNTCWRIVRTTGTGGIKMIYAGTWDATNSTCANVEDAAQLADKKTYGAQGGSAQSTSWYRNINRVGYTFNNNASIQDATDAVSVSTVFGDNSNFATTNTTNSNIKTYVESWYANNMGNTYTGKLEPSAGYCNDRSAYTDDTTTTAMTEIPPYATANASMYFGAYGRNANATNAGKAPSLTCPRGTVDLYTTNSASDGNKQLANPVALLTADEASLAGSGRPNASQGSARNTLSYLRSGSNFWLLAPYHRYTNGNAVEFFLVTTGFVNYFIVSNSFGVRPVISLTPGTSITGGTGTATDPWTVE